MFSSIPGLSFLAPPPPSCDNQKYLHRVLVSPGEGGGNGKITPVESQRAKTIHASKQSYIKHLKPTSHYDDNDKMKRPLLDELKGRIDSPTFKISIGENDKMLIICQS